MKHYFRNIKPMPANRLIILTAIFLISFGNLSFFSNVIDIYPVNLKNIAFIVSLAVVFGGMITLLLSLVCYKHTIKPVLIVILLVSAFAGYFMDSYNVIIDEAMIQNIANTDMAETLDLITLKMILYVVFLGIGPAVLVYRLDIAYTSMAKEILSRLTLSLLSIAVVISVIIAFGDYYASFFRENKALRYYANPTYYIYSSIRYLNNFIERKAIPLKQIGLDARIPSTDTHRELLIMVVGETARADRFSLNGYSRNTNPLLSKEEVISFTNFWACGTSTAISVPCMFSIFTSSDYDDTDAKTTENLLDVLKHAGVNVVWLDNNSDSKGVASRITYEDYKSAEHNPVCDLECRDEGMLSHIQSYIDAHPQGDILIVLHQMGNHGPAYYKRYPAVLEKFTPSCHTNELQNCSKEEIDNAYDNAILYTDYFLAKTIDLLKDNNTRFETALFYISDHGESLGEHGLYLHGMPNIFAPDEQLKVPAIMWFGSHFDEIDTSLLAKQAGNKYTHDNIFHTVLGFMEVQTSIYEQELDIIHGNQ